MFEYLKDKISKTEKKENVAKGIGSIGYIDLNSSISVDLTATLILAELEQTGKALPLILTNYKEKGIIKSISKQSLNETSYTLRCFFDEELEDFIQINVIDNNIDSAIIFKRYERIFYNMAKSLFIDENNNEYTEELWSDCIIGDKMFFIEKNDSTKYEYDRIFSSKEIYSTLIKNDKETIESGIEECFYHRGIESNEINREVVLVSHMNTIKEKSINIYVGLDVSVSSLKVI